MQGLVNDRQGLKPYRPVQDPEWVRALGQALMNRPEEMNSELAKQHPLATTLGYGGQFFVGQPLKYLGDVLGGFKDTGKLKASDAAQFAAFGLGMGEPGGAPAGTASVGSISESKLPFTTQLSKVLGEHRIGNTYLGENPKAVSLLRVLEKQGSTALKDELEISHIKSRLENDKINRVNDIGKVNNGFSTLRGHAKWYENGWSRAELTGPDVQYKHYGLHTVPYDGEGNYREILYRHKNLEKDFAAPHFDDVIQTRPAELDSIIQQRRDILKRYKNELFGRDQVRDQNEFKKVLNYMEEKAPDDFRRWESLGFKAREIELEGRQRLSKGLVMHRRMTEHMIDDDYALVADEFQSDVHQLGSRLGYESESWKRDEKVAKLDEQISALYDEIDKGPGSYRTKFKRFKDKFDKIDVLRAKRRKLERTPYNVPDAPYKKDWYKVMVNDSLKEAVDGGFDGFAWTTGEEQAFRNQKTETYRYSMNSEGEYIREGGTKTMLHPDGTTEVVRRSIKVSEKDLPKEVAKRLKDKAQEYKKTVERRAKLESLIRRHKTYADLNPGNKPILEWWDGLSVRQANSILASKPGLGKLLREYRIIGEAPSTISIEPTAKAKMYLDLYDKKVLDYVKKKYGVEPVKRTIQDVDALDHSVWYVPITKKMIKMLKGKASKNMPMAWERQLKGFVPA